MFAGHFIIIVMHFQNPFPWSSWVLYSVRALKIYKFATLDFVIIIIKIFIKLIACPWIYLNNLSFNYLKFINLFDLCSFYFNRLTPFNYKL